jgi:hypothetical protein
MPNAPYSNRWRNLNKDYEYGQITNPGKDTETS